MEEGEAMEFLGGQRVEAKEEGGGALGHEGERERGWPWQERKVEEDKK